MLGYLFPEVRSSFIRLFAILLFHLNSQARIKRRQRFLGQDGNVCRQFHRGVEPALALLANVHRMDSRGSREQALSLEPSILYFYFYLQIKLTDESRIMFLPFFIRPISSRELFTSKESVAE